MTLAAWIDSVGMTQTAAAEHLGVSESFLSQLLSGKRGCKHDMAAFLSAKTAGAVTVLELLYPAGLPAGARMTPSCVVRRGLPPKRRRAA